ncbi:hypothetical protein MPER_12609 [Moniliophthora perniciosa FA553]|nr:hypothetical protein MPER_12609 [Moniliophthora perniciosa FA553]
MGLAVVTSRFCTIENPIPNAIDEYTDEFEHLVRESQYSDPLVIVERFRAGLTLSIATRIGASALRPKDDDLTVWVKLARMIYVNDLETAAFAIPFHPTTASVVFQLMSHHQKMKQTIVVPQLWTVAAALITPRRPRWERHLPESFKIAATPSKSSLEIPVELQCTESGVLRATSGLIDCGATDKFIDKDYAKSNGLVLRPLSRPIPVYNVDGTPNRLGTITEMADVVLKYKNHTERTMFAVTSLGKQTVLLGYSWLEKHNPEINWQTKEVKMSCCLRYDRKPNSVVLRLAVHRKWNAQPWPTFTEDLDSEDDCALDLDDEDDSDTNRDPSVELMH